MKLLIITQKVDMNDPILGFFHRWIIEFAKHCESVVVICLEKGIHELPTNVRVLSLGKENGASRLKYLYRFYSFIWKERGNYDGVFVHMNQEYVLLGGLIWRLMKKRIYMWRNHHAGSFLTDIAASFCSKVFCTSRYSYTAKYLKTVFMPVGVDMDNFRPLENVQRVKNSVLFLGRISPSKRLDVFIDVLRNLSQEGVLFTASVYGDSIESDKKYYLSMRERVLKYGLTDKVTFYDAVPNYETIKIYSAHGIFVNTSSSGMYDKTIFESMACGCLTLASNDNLRGQISDDFIFKQGDVGELIRKLNTLLAYSDEQRLQANQELIEFAQSHSLKKLADRLFNEII